MCRNLDGLDFRGHFFAQLTFKRHELPEPEVFPVRVLVVIPSLIHKYTFSAPLAWLFGGHADKVRGIYGFDLTPDIVRSHDRFIVELSWFIELYEFHLVVRFIRKYNPGAVILFGGLHAQMVYRDIFRSASVDYFIRGDNELPISLFLDNEDPRRIPNMVGRDFANDITYRFEASAFRDIEFNLDWFPDYAKRWQEFPQPDEDTPVRFDMLPLLPQYWEKPQSELPLALRWRVPPKGGRYHLPMLITCRGACAVAHEGCEYCLGSRCNDFKLMYGRPALVMSNDDVICLLHKIERKFDMVTLFINSANRYDFAGCSFDLDATIEYDGPVTAKNAGNIIHAFRKSVFQTGLSGMGLVGKGLRRDIDAFRSIEDESHHVYFFASPEDATANGIPEEKRLYMENVLPDWTDWKFYSDPRKAFRRSRGWYFMTGQTNLYSTPQKLALMAMRFCFTHAAFVLNRAGVVNLKKLLI